MAGLADFYASCISLVHLLGLSGHNEILTTLPTPPLYPAPPIPYPTPPYTPRIPHPPYEKGAYPNWTCRSPTGRALSQPPAGRALTQPAVFPNLQLYPSPSGHARPPAALPVLRLPFRTGLNPSSCIPHPPATFPSSHPTLEFLNVPGCGLQASY